MEIRVGSSWIMNYSDYWSMKERLKMYIDMKQRSLGWEEDIINTPFSKSTDDTKLISLLQRIDEMSECIMIFEQKYPKK